MYSSAYLAMKKMFRDSIFFKWLFPPVIHQLFTLHVHKVVFVKYKSDRYKKGTLDHWGNFIVSWIYFVEKGVAIIKLSYNYMTMMSVQKGMEKLINDNITLFLSKISKLLCSYIVHLSYFPT